MSVTNKVKLTDDHARSVICRWHVPYSEQFRMTTLVEISERVSTLVSILKVFSWEPSKLISRGVPSTC